MGISDNPAGRDVKGLGAVLNEARGGGAYHAVQSMPITVCANAPRVTGQWASLPHATKPLT